MKNEILKREVFRIDPKDNVAVALKPLQKGDLISVENIEIVLEEDIAAKHKFSMVDLGKDEDVLMYGVTVGKVNEPIKKGCLLTIENIRHATASMTQKKDTYKWNPSLGTELKSSFLGYDRGDGTIGTANHWLVIPMVFCQNRNVEIMKESLLEVLGYSNNSYKDFVNELKTDYASNHEDRINVGPSHVTSNTSVKTFPNVDGIQFLNHDGGCGGDRKDSQTLIQLLAGYICHGNVAGVTILGLGCEHAQFALLEEAIYKINPNLKKPIYFLSQQKEGLEEVLIKKAIKKTFKGLIEANKVKREKIDISKLIIGVECGGSDGFSGISSNVVLGELSDHLIQQKGSVLLSEFPELCGVEQEIVNRCKREETAERFLALMSSYESLANSKGASFSANPSPGNINDGLITDAIKSAGAVKKGGTSPIVDVLDYTEPLTRAGLNLLCTPGNDVESTTGLVASGAHIILFSTGLGTPTGNPIAPVIKVSSNTTLFQKMHDIIDFDAGQIIDGSQTPAELAVNLHHLCLKVASGEQKTKAQQMNQNDFLLWKRGISL